MSGAPAAPLAHLLHPTSILELSMMTADESERLLTRDELAAYWRVSPKTVSRISEKDLPVVRIGNRFAIAVRTFLPTRGASVHDVQYWPPPVFVVIQ